MITALSANRCTGLLTLVVMAACALFGGCIHNKPTAVPTTQTATDIDPATAKAEYWLDRPAIAHVSNTDYRKLFDECEHSLRMRYFPVDRLDYREGLVTSKPLISQQIWEFWRRDVGSTSQIVDSSLATYRRTIRWQIQRSNDGAYIASPRVVIEHYIGEPDHSAMAIRVESAVSSGYANPQQASPLLSSAGPSKWYAVGRDEPLERLLAQGVQDRLSAR